jgi:hypothetical protein
MSEAWRAGGAQPNMNVLSAEARKLLSMGNCDGGFANSMWQIHDEGGIVLDGQGWRHVNGAKDLESAFTGETMRADRKAAIRVALHMVRQSLLAHAGLCQYTGEPGPCPKGALRLSFASRWWAAHPFVDDADAAKD